MNANTVELTRRIKALEAAVEIELAKRRIDLRFGLERGKALFEAAPAQGSAHRPERYIVNAKPLIVVTAPFIYALIIPLLLLDVCVTIYQAICFPIYHLQKVRRVDYLIFDRHHLAYLNALEKINCLYCSYANGLIAYVAEVAARTEAYWCPIKHARRLINAHYADFADFGDAEAYQKTIAALDSSTSLEES